MVFDKLGKFFGPSDDEFEEGYEYETDDNVVDGDNLGRDNVVSIKAGNSPTSKIVLFEPRVYADAKDVAKHLMDNKAIIINFSRMEDGQAKRVVDFITGTVYALNGAITRVGDKIFLATPPKFETDGKIAELLDKKETEY